jgi:PAS domain S-box-containing protein
MLRRLLRHRLVVEWVTLAAVLVVATAVAAQERWFWRVNLVLYDVALSLWERPAPNDIVIVAIDDLSLAEIGRWPWRRAVHATLLDRLTAAGARAVALDLILSEPDLRDPAGDASLGDAIRRNGHTVLPVVLEAGRDGALNETLPIPAFAERAAGLGHISIELDGDGIARSVYLEEGLGSARWPHLAAALLGVIDPHLLAALPGERNQGRTKVPGVWMRDRWLHIPYGGLPGHFRQVPYVDVLRGSVPPDALRDKFVLVGMTATGAGDAYATPRAAEGRPMPGVEIVGHVLDSLKSGIGITTLDGWAPTALSGMAVAALLLAFLWLTPSQSLAAAGLAILATLLAAVLAARYLQVWIAPAAPLFGLILCYPLWSWRRLAATQRYLNAELVRLNAEPGILPRDPRNAKPAPSFAVDVVEARLEAVRAATERLRNLRQFLADISMSLPDALLVADHAGRVVSANARAAEYLHAPSASELQGRPLDEHLAALGLVADHRWERLAREAPTSLETRQSDGRELLLNVVPCTDHEGRRIGLIVRLADVTSLKQAERQRGELMRFLSHDMRSPQASILMLVTRQRESPNAPPVAGVLAQIERCARKTLALADDFVQLARAQARDAVDLQSLDLASVASDAADEVWLQAQSKRIRIERELDLAEAWVRGDRKLLTRALANLLSNAIKYSPAGTRVRFSLARDGTGIACIVADQGEGIPVEAVPRLFEPFQRFAVERHPEVDGSGLGLAFVKASAERHSGRITFASTSEGGSRFTLWLPAETGEHT